MDEHADEMKATKQRLAGLEQYARQSRLAMEANGLLDIKTRERTEGAAAAVQAKHGDSCSANRVYPDPMCLTSFGDNSIGPPALPRSRNDALVGNGAAAPKSCPTLGDAHNTRFSLRVWKMNRLTRDETAEPVSRDQILRRERRQGNIHFPCSADHEQDWQPHPVVPYSAICVTIHTYIHQQPRVAYSLQAQPLQ